MKKAILYLLPLVFVISNFSYASDGVRVCVNPGVPACVQLYYKKVACKDAKLVYSGRGLHTLSLSCRPSANLYQERNEQFVPMEFKINQKEFPCEPGGRLSLVGCTTPDASQIVVSAELKVTSVRPPSTTWFFTHHTVGGKNYYTKMEITLSSK